MLCTDFARYPPFVRGINTWASSLVIWASPLVTGGFPPIWSVMWTWHYNDVMMTTSQITSPTVVYSTVYSDADQRNIKLRVTGLCVGNSPGPVNSPHKGPVTRKMFPFDDVIMRCILCCQPEQSAAEQNTVALWLHGVHATVINRRW